jgi:hypothetical protein
MDNAANFITLALAATILFMYLTGKLGQWFGGVA